MILKDIKTRAQFTKDSQTFWFDVELERNSGGIQHCIVQLEKGFNTADTADKLEDLARQVREV